MCEINPLNEYCCCECHDWPEFISHVIPCCRPNEFREYPWQKITPPMREPKVILWNS